MKTNFTMVRSLSSFFCISISIPFQRGFCKSNSTRIGSAWAYRYFIFIPTKNLSLLDVVFSYVDVACQNIFYVTCRYSRKEFIAADSILSNPNIDIWKQFELLRIKSTKFRNIAAYNFKNENNNNIFAKTEDYGSFSDLKNKHIKKNS